MLYIREEKKTEREILISNGMYCPKMKLKMSISFFLNICFFNLKYYFKTDSLNYSTKEMRGKERERYRIKRNITFKKLDSSKIKFSEILITSMFSNSF